MGTEMELLRQCRQGDTDAWDQLFQEHYAPAGRFVHQLGHDLTREDVEEICQETFLSVIRNLSSFQGGCRFQTWLFRIAANKTRDYRERRQAAKRGGGAMTVSLQTESSEGTPILDPPSNAPAPDLELMNVEQAGIVHQSLDELESSCREIIQLRYFADLSYEEISAALTLNPKTVSSRLSKCLDRLESILRNMLSRGKPAQLPSNF